MSGWVCFLLRTGAGSVDPDEMSVTVTTELHVTSDSSLQQARSLDRSAAVSQARSPVPDGRSGLRGALPRGKWTRVAF